MFALKALMARSARANLDCRQDGAMIDPRGAARLPLQCHDRRHRAPTRC
jgi:hypothetical protein